jgi:short subunit dehydrogenase-like uncharacterized protein
MLYCQSLTDTACLHLLLLRLLRCITQINLAGRGESGAKVEATFSYDKGDMGYKATAVMLAEAGLTLALADHSTMPVRGGGVLTPATLGMPLVERLRGAGFTCTVQDADVSSSGNGHSKRD